MAPLWGANSNLHWYKLFNGDLLDILDSKPKIKEVYFAINPKEKKENDPYGYLISNNNGLNNSFRNSYDNLMFKATDDITYQFLIFKFENGDIDAKKYNETWFKYHFYIKTMEEGGVQNANQVEKIPKRKPDEIAGNPFEGIVIKPFYFLVVLTNYNKINYSIERIYLAVRWIFLFAESFFSIPPKIENVKPLFSIFLKIV